MLAARAGKALPPKPVQSVLVAAPTRGASLGANPTAPGEDGAPAGADQAGQE